MSEKLTDYQYEYPEELVAQEPLAKRDASRMMVLSSQRKTIRHSCFADLPEFMSEGDLLVVNDTSVMPSRLWAQKPTGGKVEFLLIRSTGPLEWTVLLSPARGLKEGMELELFSREKDSALPIKITVTSLDPDDFRVCFPTEEAQHQALSHYGEMPLPPYIKREGPLEKDRERYQTIYAQRTGAVAAPTAGLHFTEKMRGMLRERGVHWSSVTLHVGPGTFLPVKTEDIENHVMHEEWYEIPEDTLNAIEECKSKGKRVVAVGTTTLRALESWAMTQKTQGWTNLFIRPGFHFQTVDSLLTNFHQPQSTLLILVAALAGRDFILNAYGEAISQCYRLFSYGDCMLVTI